MDASLVAIRDRVKYLEKYNQYKKGLETLNTQLEELKAYIQRINKENERKLNIILQNKNITMDEYKSMDPLIAKTFVPSNLIPQDVRNPPHRETYINLLNGIYKYQQILQEMNITEEDTFEKLKEKEMLLLEKLTSQL